MPQLQPTYPEVNVWAYPVDPDAAYRSPCALHDTFTGLLLPNRGEGGGDDVDSSAFDSVFWTGQTNLENIYGAIEFIRVDAAGNISRGVQAATETKPQEERCGFTLRPRVTRLHSVFPNAARFPGSLPYDLRPRLPLGEPTLEWVSQQGESWENVLPAARPLWGALHHRTAPANVAIKVKTKTKWAKDAGLGFTLDGAGVAWGHIGEPGVRLEWGNRYSLVFRSVGKDARAQMERKGADKDGRVQWRVWQRFGGSAPLDEAWWKSRHTVYVYRLAEQLVVEIDGQGFMVADVVNDKPRPINWAAAPLRFSNTGADMTLQIAALDWNHMGGFTRTVPMSAAPTSPVAFDLTGPDIHRVPMPGLDTIPNTGVPLADAVMEAFFGGGRAAMKGAGLERTQFIGNWFEDDEGEGRVEYQLKLRGTLNSAPFLCAFAMQFPPTAPTLLPAPINLRAALTSLEVESGDPETLPSTQVTFELSKHLLETHVPGWESAVLPFRPLHVETDINRDDNWQTLFWGYLIPDGESGDGFNSHKINVRGLDPKVRLRAPAGLVDERFGPLDLDVTRDGGALYGAQSVQKLIGYELGPDVAAKINGNGDPMRYFPASHYPLAGNQSANFFVATGVPDRGGFFLPPPFGDDIEKWIGTLGTFDHAACFYDPMLGTKGAWVYGRADLIFKERGQTVHTLNEVGPVEVLVDDRLSAWPILAAYSAQGLLEKAYTRVKVWGKADAALEAFAPSLYTGEARTELDASNPLSETASWRRTLLSRQEFIGETVAFDDYAQALAQTIWIDFDGRAPERYDFTLPDQILIARWGEKLNWKGVERRVIRHKLNWTFGEGEACSTTINARSLSATGF